MDHVNDEGQAQRAKGFYQSQHPTLSGLTEEEVSDLKSKLADTQMALTELVGTLTQHSYEDVLGRVKGTWSRRVENKTRRLLGVPVLPEKN
jgi:hypothetical protein